MSDIFDFFTEGADAYGGSFWLYSSTNGIISLGEAFRSESEAEHALCDYAHEALTFVSVSRDLDYASAAYRDKLNLALVTHGDRITREAQLPPAWLPPGDPRLLGRVNTEDGQHENR